MSVYLDPPERVPGIDHKSQAQAFDRTRSLLLLRPGQRRPHAYKRNGTTSPFAVLDVAAGEVTCFRRCEEFRKFLNYDNVQSDIHIVMDNDAIHKTAASATSQAPARPLHPDIRLMAGRTFFIDEEADEARRSPVDHRS